jgi:tetratricopeptide (TPR) repeat protein
MIATVGESETLSSILAHAPQRRFAGLVLDGIDVTAATAAETNGRLLERAFDVAQRTNEKIWAERFARRAYAIEEGPASRLCLASILASVGQCDEARSLVLGIPAKADDELYRRVLGVLHAKAGRVDEAIAIFDTLPGRLPRYHPAAVVLSAAQEMMEQCDPAHTMALVTRLAEDYPAHLLIRSLQLRCHLYAGRFDRARELAQIPELAIGQATSFDRRAFIEAVADSFDLHGWMNTLFDFARKWIEKDRAHWSLYDRAATSARAASREMEYDELIAAIPSSVRGSAEALAVICRRRLDENRIEEALRLLNEIHPLSATLFLEARLHLSLYARDQSKIDEAFAACDRCGIPPLGPVVALGIHTYYYDCSLDKLRNRLAKLEPFSRSRSNNMYFWQTYLRCLIAFGEQEKAAETYHGLPAGLASGATLGPFRMYFDAMQGRHERARTGWTKHIHATRHLCVNAASSYPRTVQLNYTETAGAVLLFVTLFNARDYLSWFLAHYRKLGVDHFFVTDNGSTDGSLELLCGESDVSVFSNRESFARSAFGVLWVNHLLQRFGIGHWCFHVDCDEAFVFPGYEGNRSLRAMLSYCDKRGFCSVPAIEVDMYPERLDIGADADPFKSSCYFDVDYVAVPSELPPYVMIKGGIRERLIGLALSMQKSPLIRMAADVRYIECNHATTHLPVADVTAALLHYKFVGDMKGRLEQAINRGEHFAGAIAYRRLNSAVDVMGWDETLLSPDSRRYDGPDTLLRHGLIGSGGMRLQHSREKTPTDARTD